MADPAVTSKQIAELLDRQAIWECELRYARGIDRLDEQLIRSAFWEDAYSAHGPVNGSIDEFLAFWLPTQPSREASQHVLFNHTVWLDGDLADAETYFLSYGKKAGIDSVEMVAGRYLDRLVKQAGEWRIKNRMVLADLHCKADASEMADKLSRSHTGSRSSSDPSYQRPAQSQPADAAAH